MLKNPSKKFFGYNLLNLINFSNYGIFIYKRINNKTMNNTKMRQFRELSDETKAKISMAMKGKSKSFTHKENISNGLKDYWKTIPNKPTSEKVED